jgi:hypothetical protein
VAALTDSRPRPQIETGRIWLAGFIMFVLRLPSLNALENALRDSKRWRGVRGNDTPSADTIGRVFSCMSMEPLRLMTVALNKNAWRSKAIHQRPGQSHRVVAIDGHETVASRSRCCDQCLVRDVRIKTKGKNAKERRVKEYYHRIVTAQWVGCTPPPILDIEMVLPGEGEVVAAKRLLERILRQYPRLIDVITADAIYLEAPFIRMVTDARKHVIVVMKQEARDLYKDAERLRPLIQSRTIQDGKRTTLLWDIPDLLSFTTLGQRVRVVWAEEKTVAKKVVPESKPSRTAERITDSTWIWVTTLDASVPATKIQQWGHDRWDLENRGFNELVTHWHMDHCFVHNPTAMATFLLTLAIAFLTTYLFYERNLRPQVRPATRLALAFNLLNSLGSLHLFVSSG